MPQPLLTRVLYGPHGVRTGWRALLWVQATSFTTTPPLIALMVLFALAQPDLTPLLLISINASMAIPLWLGTWATVRFIDQAPMTSIGLGGPLPRAIAHTALGALIGVALIGLIVLALALIGHATLAWTGAAPLDWLLWLLILAFAAFMEELMFRGYPFVWLARGLGAFPATALLALAFAALHLSNPAIGLLGFLNIAAASVLLSVARLRSGAIWLPTGLHWGWNAAQGILFGVPISGLSDAAIPTLLNTSLTGPDWLSGAAFGFEGSALALATVAAASVALMAWRSPGPPAP